MSQEQLLDLGPAGRLPRYEGPRVGTYCTILADPPWPERGAGQVKRGADRHYPLMSVDEILALPVEQLAAPDAHLYLWVTNNYLLDGLHVLSTWGFEYITMITWAKDRIGLGQYFRGQTEHVLFGRRGQPPYRTLGGKRQQGTTLITAPRGAHSAKPPQLRAWAEDVSHGPRIELFARERAPGWDAWGNQVETDARLVTAEVSAQLELGGSHAT